MGKSFRTIFVALLYIILNIQNTYCQYSMVGDFVFYLDDTNMTASVSGCMHQGDIVIPENVVVGENKYYVTSIGEYAFYGYWLLTSITIPNSVTSIGTAAFQNCI